MLIGWGESVKGCWGGEEWKGKIGEMLIVGILIMFVCG